jgi:DNA-directed RNA polymerase beta subunit
MYNGSTGEQLKGGIFIGPTYYQRLKQMPVDKYYHRRTGRADMVTRQPVGGRAQGGALKFGEMERDSLLSHGISLFTKEAFNEKSDGFHYRVGTATGDVEPPQLSGKVNPEQYTPVRRSAAFLADGDAGGFREYMANEATDVTDYKSHADVVRNETVRTNIPTSQVNVPFSTRLLTQECEAMGVGMHLLPANRHPTRIRIAK